MPDQTTMTEGISTNLSTLFVSLALFVIFTSLLCNLVVMTTVYICKESSSPIDWFILNISMCDIVTSLFSTLAIDNIFMDWSIADVFCKVSYAFSYAGFAATVLTLFVMTIERYYGICRSAEYQKRCLAKMFKWSIPGIWVISVLLFAAYFEVYGRRTIALTGGKTGRVCDENLGSFYGAIFYIIIPFLFLTVALPIFMTIVLVKVLNKLHVARTPSSGGSAVLNMRRKSTIKMLFVMMVLHYLCWLPTIILKLTSHYGAILPWYWIMLAFFDIPHHARSIFYTLTYCIMYPGFRSNLKSICSICLCCVTQKPTKKNRYSTSKEKTPTPKKNDKGKAKALVVDEEADYHC